jgi:DNA-binding MarR family transcriptional regulator
MKKKAPSLADEDYRALAEFRRALRQFLAFSEQAAAQAGLTAAQHQALLAIKGIPGNGQSGGLVHVGSLADWLGVRHHSCVGLVERLVSLGLVAKRADPRDGRRVVLKLTGRAERKLAALSAVHRDELRRRAGTLGLLLAAIR